MKTNVRGKVLPADIIAGTGYADLGAAVDALGLAELVVRLVGIPVVDGANGRPLVALRVLAQKAGLIGLYREADDTFYIDPLPLPALPAQPVGHDVAPWHLVTPVIAGGPGERRPDLLERIIRQFRVAENYRYQANRQKQKETYCNIFVWDVTRALGCEIPHWVADDGEPSSPDRGRELDANAVHAWLHHRGADFGWRRVDAAEALLWANMGRPAVAAWLNVGGIGHVTMVRPGDPHPTRGLPIAQAGARNFDDGFLADGFGARAGVEFWIHD